MHSSGRVYYSSFADSDEISVLNADLTNEIIIKIDQVAGSGTYEVRDLNLRGINSIDNN